MRLEVYYTIAYVRGNLKIVDRMLADRIYRNRDNLLYCKEHSIRLSGPKLGRPLSKALMKKAGKRIERQDAWERNAVEGKFGEVDTPYR